MRLRRAKAVDLDGVLGGDASDEEEREYQGKESRGGDLCTSWFLGWCRC